MRRRRRRRRREALLLLPPPFRLRLHLLPRGGSRCAGLYLRRLRGLLPLLRRKTLYRCRRRRGGGTPTDPPLCYLSVPGRCALDFRLISIHTLPTLLLVIITRVLICCHLHLEHWNRGDFLASSSLPAVSRRVAFCGSFHTSILFTYTVLSPNLISR